MRDWVRYSLQGINRKHIQLPVPSPIRSPGPPPTRIYAATYVLHYSDIGVAGCEGILHYSGPY